MRVALGFERALDEVVRNGATENSRWYAVMASGPLRQVFETVFGLPDGFGTLDVDQQLSVFKDRAEARFGATDPAALNSPDLREQIRKAYLFGSDLALQGPFPDQLNQVFARWSQGGSIGCALPVSFHTLSSSSHP